MSKIGYHRLNQAEQALYERYETAFEKFLPGVDLSGIGQKTDLMLVLQTVLGDHPEVFYFNKSRLMTSRSLLFGSEIRFEDVITGAKRQAMTARLEQAVQTALEEIEERNPMTDYDRLICIYEYLQDHVTYDNQELECLARTGHSGNMLSHSAYGALVNGTAVCDGISGAMALLAQKMGYECSVVSGDALFRTTDFSGHSWNIIRVRDQHYFLDATWDVNGKSTTGAYAYHYFMVNEDTIAVNHRWEARLTPPCRKEDLSYYAKNRLTANNLTQMKEILRRYTGTKQRQYRVRLAPGIPVPEPQEETMGQLLQDVLTRSGIHCSFYYVWDRDSRCFFANIT